jgi:glutaconate CoA-transferase subunit A
LQELAALVPNGASIALGGSFLHRGPFAFVRELIRQEKRDLELIKQSPGYDVDILCRAGVLRRVRAGIVAMEGNFGLAPWYRRAVERHEIELEEHACASLTAGLRAAAFGVPFQPCGGLHGSGLPELNGWKCLEDPYGSGEKTWVVPAIRPDFAVIQASEVDAQGNVRVHGTAHWDRIMSRAAGSVLVVAEKQVDSAVFEAQPESTLVPYFMVQAYAVVPRGAWPGSCWPDYAIDYPAVETYMDKNSDLRAHLAAAPEAREGNHG